MGIRFGPAGNSNSFYEEGHKSTLEAPAWLAGLGLNAYEYQCGRGVHTGEATARKMAPLFATADIALSIHAPYYINLASEDGSILAKSKIHLLKSMRLARWMGAGLVVFHPGSALKGERAPALARACHILQEVLRESASEGLEDILLSPETMGKPSVLGNLEEIIELCLLGDRVVPTVDFGHLHAAGGGGFLQREAFGVVLDKIEERLGFGAIRDLHIHFSPIEYTAAGERRHRTTLEKDYGPPFGPLAELIRERKLSPTIICESDGRQAEDALVYKKIYQEAGDSSQ